MTNDNNFTELKRLFETEVAAMAQAHAQRYVNESTRIKDEDKSRAIEEGTQSSKPQATANLFARLLDGCTIEAARQILDIAHNYIEQQNKVRSDDIPPFS